MTDLSQLDDRELATRLAESWLRLRQAAEEYNALKAEQKRRYPKTSVHYTDWGAVISED